MHTTIAAAVAVCPRYICTYRGEGAKATNIPPPLFYANCLFSLFLVTTERDQTFSIFIAVSSTVFLFHLARTTSFTCLTRGITFSTQGDVSEIETEIRVSFLRKRKDFSLSTVGFSGSRMEMGLVEKKAQQREKRVAEQSISPSTRPSGKVRKGEKERKGCYGSLLPSELSPCRFGKARGGGERRGRRGGLCLWTTIVQNKATQKHFRSLFSSLVFLRKPSSLSSLRVFIIQNRFTKLSRFVRNLCVVFDVVGDYGAKVQNAFSDWETIEAAMEEEGRKEGALPQSGGTQKNKRRIRFFQICVVFLCINVEGERMHERKNLGGLVPPFLSSSKRPAWNPVCERADGRLATFRFAPPGNRAKKPSRYRYFSFFSILFASKEAKYRMGFCDSILFSIFFVGRS